MEAVEFYSGLGGLAVAADLGSLGQIRTSICFDIHPLANKCHQHNFPNVTSSTKTICNLTKKSFRKYFADPPSVWLLSPPCQPFTRRGLQKDLEDNRNASFLHLIQLMKILDEDQLPNYFLVENVAFFENSQTHTFLTKTLTELNYNFQEFLLSPTQFNIPNQRLRYFCLAKKKPLNFRYPEYNSQLIRFIPGFQHSESCRAVREFLEQTDEGELFEAYQVAEDVLVKKGRLFDIVTAEAQSTNCFTKSYGRFVEGSGSIIGNDLAIDNDQELLPQLKAKKLRFFSPREMLNLHGFPEHYSFPNDVSNLQAYKLIGNSLSVTVVSELVRYLLLGQELQ